MRRVSRTRRARLESESPFEAARRGPQIFNLGFNDENKLKIHVLSSSNLNVANLKWTLSYNEGTEIASGYVAYVDGEAEIVFDDEIGGGGLINIALYFSYVSCVDRRNYE